MEKSSEFIRKKEFHIVFKGYKPEEVDKFLDILSVEFERLVKKNRELQESLDKLKFESTVEEDSDIKKIIQDALISAHKVAEDIKNQAKMEAEEIILEKKQSEEKTMGDLQMKKLQIEESIIVMQSKYDEFKGKIKKTIEELNQFLTEDNIDYRLEREFTEDMTTQEPANELQQQEIIYKAEDIKEQEQRPEPEEAKQEKLEENKIKKDSQVKTSRDFNDLEIYNIKERRDSGYYFDKDRIKSDKEIEETGTPDKTEKEPEDVNHSKEASPGLKRERKKIDIANPDIIENFFRASDD